MSAVAVEAQVMCAECAVNLNEENGDHQFSKKRVCTPCFVELCKHVVLADIKNDHEIGDLMKALEQDDLQHKLLEMDPEFKKVNRIVYGERLLASLIINAHTVRH